MTKDPEGNIGKEGVERLTRIAGVLLQRALNKVRTEPVQARELFEESFSMQLQGDAYYDRILKHWEELGKTTGEQ